MCATCVTAAVAQSLFTLFQLQSRPDRIQMSGSKWCVLAVTLLALQVAAAANCATSKHVSVPSSSLDTIAAHAHRCRVLQDGEVSLRDGQVVEHL